MTFGFLRWLHRRGVSRGRLRDTWLHRVLGDRLFSKDLWAFRRDAVARGWFIGAVVAATPLLGVQLLLGLPLALLGRANLLVVIALIFTTNPVTAGLFYPFAFLVGCRVMGRPVNDFHWDNTPVWHAGGPLFLGCAVIGLVVGLTGYILLRLLWRERTSPAKGSGEI
ncbi:MAG: DUF2062 domain-containing protein [Verrucomicrobia bacterium]|nr:DUF2062 domain-containing protein [Verrucomicrobiota bacterium]